ncbi:MAG: CPBP family intramembrane metalloprotease [Runella slithyformis]|nr:MAG: CPBP family intramembrane metalloprotease [Runella slithyformis]TAF44336.1 MAG: CPBP family intramembrane metalloprotease [Runella slithyformis]TAF80731.1 MAG: CPBP family intramembrane metalloprotease [Runella slithyformis]
MKPSSTFLRFWGYVKRPVYYSSNIAVPNPLKTFWELFKVNLYSILGLFILAFIFVLLGTLLGVEEPENQSEDDWFYVFVVIVFAPLLEELIFRWPLRYSENRVTIVAVIAFIVFYSELSKIEDFDKTAFWILFFGGAVAVGVGANFFKNQIRTFWILHFKWIYWIFGLIFGLTHLANYSGEQISFLVYWPILCTHQIVTGLLNGYARMRYGFWYGVALHAANNTIPAVILIVELLTEK